MRWGLRLALVVARVRAASLATTAVRRRSRATCSRASRSALRSPYSRSAGRPRSPSTRGPATCSTRTTRRARSIPASNEKLPVSWAALSRLGTGFRFHTEVLGAGARAGATWRRRPLPQGLRRPDADRRATSAGSPTPCAARASRAVTGRILGDESFYDSRRGAPGWKRTFVGDRDAAAVRARRRPRPRLARASSPPLLAARALRARARRARRAGRRAVRARVGAAGRRDARRATCLRR